MLVTLTYYSKTAEVCSTDKNKRSYDFTVCLPFWDSLTGSQQQMLRLNTIVRSYRAGDDVIFSMPEKNGLPSRPKPPWKPPKPPRRTPPSP